MQFRTRFRLDHIWKAHQCGNLRTLLVLAKNYSWQRSFLRTAISSPCKGSPNTQHSCRCLDRQSGQGIAYRILRSNCCSFSCWSRAWECIEIACAPLPYPSLLYSTEKAFWYLRWYPKRARQSRLSEKGKWWWGQVKFPETYGKLLCFFDLLYAVGRISIPHIG